MSGLPTGLISNEADKFSPALGPSGFAEAVMECEPAQTEVLPLVDGDEYFSAWFEMVDSAINDANQGIPATCLLYAYRLSPDLKAEGCTSAGPTVAEKLAEACKAGVDVRVRLSGHLKQLPNLSAYDRLRRASIPVSWAPNPLRRAS